MDKKFTVIRTIHPVGQGAFYTEEFFDNQHDVNHTVVFDCGSKTKPKSSRAKTLYIDNVVNSSFGDKQKIDLFFISHFDEDHVNGIKVPSPT
ncbi:hypothetical protein LPYR103PRE_24430 [Segatella asaccharophila]